MKVVVVDWDVTLPMNSGKRLRTLNLMLQLANRHEITYFSRGDGNSPEGLEAQKFLTDHRIKTVFANIPVTGNKKKWHYYPRLAISVFMKNPFSVNAHMSTRFAKALQDFASTHEVDLWQLEWTPYVDMLQGISPLRTIVVAHNVDTLIWQRYHETEANPVRRWFIKNQWQKFKRYEQEVFHRADSVVAVSEDDAAILRQQFGVEQVDVVDNGVDIASYQAVTAVRNPSELLFLGSLDWRPNLDGVRLLLDEILPGVLQQEPRVKLTLVGRNPPPWLVERAIRMPRVELCANVPDVRPYLARAGMMVVPLRIGGGSRLKILEALANGLPVVATRVAAEGLQLAPGEDYRMADTSDAMSESIVDWIRHPKVAQHVASKGQQVVSEHYGWDKLAEALEAVWEKTAKLTSPVGC